MRDIKIKYDEKKILIDLYLNFFISFQIYVHGSDLESFYKFVPRRFLPEEYGGRAGPIKIIVDKWVQILISNRDFIRNIDRYGIDPNQGEGSGGSGSGSVSEADDDVIVID